MRKDTAEKAAEIRQHSRKKAESWYAAVAQLEKTAEFMAAHSIDYGAAYAAIQQAIESAKSNAASNYADYKNADKMATGEKPTMHNAK